MYANNGPKNHEILVIFGFLIIYWITQFDRSSAVLKLNPVSLKKKKKVAM